MKQVEHRFTRIIAAVREMNIIDRLFRCECYRCSAMMLNYAMFTGIVHRSTRYDLLVAV